MKFKVLVVIAFTALTLGIPVNTQADITHSWTAYPGGVCYFTVWTKWWGQTKCQKVCYSTVPATYNRLTFFRRWKSAGGYCSW